MALTMAVGFTCKEYLTCALTTPPSAVPVLQPALPLGQTIGSLVSADPATVDVAIDSPSVPDPQGGVNFQSVSITSPSAPAQPNVAIVQTLVILNSDGSTFGTFTDTITINPALPPGEVIGDYFGTPIAVTAGKRR